MADAPAKPTSDVVTADEHLPAPGAPRAPQVTEGVQPTLPAQLLAAAGAAYVDELSAPELATIREESYRIIGELGRGGMGKVSVAVDQRLGRRLAVKELLLLGDDAKQRFVREALVTARLQHPSIVPVYEAGRWPGGQPFYAMKLLSGRPLGQMLRDRKSAEQRLQFLPQLVAVAEAMAYAHSQRVIHRDLKPDNIVVGNFGETVVIDWGLAKVLTEPDSERPTPSDVVADAPVTGDPQRPDSATRAGARMGTPGFASPEQAAGLRVDERTDVYALGAILYQMLTGFPPRAAAGFDHSLMRSGGEMAPQLPPPVTFPPLLPIGLVEVCTRALAHNPDDRPADAQEFRRALDRAISQRSADMLVAEAERDLAKLDAALAEAQRNRAEIYSLFGACRFGFEQARTSFPDSAAARHGLERAVAALVGYELAAGDVKAARAVLMALQPPPPALLTAVTEAERVQAEEEARRSELVAIGRDFDQSIGRGTRLWLAAIVGCAWTAAPLVSILMEPLDYWHFITVSLIFFVGLGALGLAAPMMMKTALNRSLVYAVMALHLLQVIMYLGHQALGIPVASSDVQHLLIWSLGVGCFAVAMDRRLLIPAVVYSIGFVVSARAPWTRKYLQSGGNLVLTLTALWMWWRPRARKPDGVSSRP